MAQGSELNDMRTTALTGLLSPETEPKQVRTSRLFTSSAFSLSGIRNMNASHICVAALPFVLIASVVLWAIYVHVMTLDVGILPPGDPLMIAQNLRLPLKYATRPNRTSTQRLNDDWLVSMSYSSLQPLALPGRLHINSIGLFYSFSSQDAKWVRYLQLLYGAPAPSFNYSTMSQSHVLDLNDFDMVRSDILDEVGLLESVGHLVASPMLVSQGDIMHPWMCPHLPRQAYTCISSSLHFPYTIWLFGGVGFEDPMQVPRERRLQPVQNDSWVEVVHTRSPIHIETGEEQRMTAAWRSMVKNNFWMYRAVGSGTYYNVGRTISFGYHHQAAAFFLGETCEHSRNIYGERHNRGSDCSENFDEWADAARKMGYDTIQFTFHDDPRCGNTALEIVSVCENIDGGTACMFSNMSASMGVLAGGYAASRPCACTEYAADRGILHC